MFPVDPISGDPILILQLRSKRNYERIHIECRLVKGEGSIHACFSPVCVAVLTDEEDNEKDNEKDNKEDNEKNSETFKMKIETIGRWHKASQIFIKACNVLDDKFNLLHAALKSDTTEKIVFKPFYGKYPAYDIEFSDEDDTLGNLLQDSIYRSVKDWKSEDKEITFVAYKIPHPLKKIMVLRISLKLDQDINSEDYKHKVKELLKKHLDILQNKNKDIKSRFEKFVKEKLSSKH